MAGAAAPPQARASPRSALLAAAPGVQDRRIGQALGMRTVYTGIGLVVWKAGALIGIPYAKRKLEERD